MWEKYVDIVYKHMWTCIITLPCLLFILSPPQLVLPNDALPFLLYCLFTYPLFPHPHPYCHPGIHGSFSLSLSMSALSPWPPFIIDSQPPAFLPRLVWCLVIYTRSTQTSADASCAPTKKNPIDTPYSFLTTLVSILFEQFTSLAGRNVLPEAKGPLPLSV